MAMTQNIFRSTLKSAGFLNQKSPSQNWNLVRYLATIFDGKELAREIKTSAKDEISQLKLIKPSFSPKFIAIAVGDHTSSKVYLANKVKSAKESSIDCDILHVPADTKELDLINMITDLNEDASVNGIIVQLPLPSHMSEIKVCNSVDPSKDVDGFTQINLGRTLQNIGQCPMVPCTVLAVKKIVEAMKIKTHAANSVVIGRSHNVGMPIAVMLASDAEKGGFDMTTTLCHRYTPLHITAAACSTADLIVSAAGVPSLVRADMVKEGVAVIDVAITRVKDERGKNVVVGDVDKGVKDVAGVVTPVPGGVGPVTVACLMYNTLLAAKLQHGMAENKNI